MNYLVYFISGTEYILYWNPKTPKENTIITTEKIMDTFDFLIEENQEVLGLDSSFLFSSSSLTFLSSSNIFSKAYWNSWKL
jgi:hypothetical protein